MGLIERLARDAPIPVSLVAGSGGTTLLEPLRIDARFTPVPSPRQATLLVGAGTIPEGLLEPLMRLHDGIAHPRAIAWLVSTDRPDSPALPGLMRLGPPYLDDLVRLGAGLRAGHVPSTSAMLPNEDPAPWRGVGPYGQGGSGMTGGVPYGRPMAGLAPDRDGLRLDRLPTVVGPWFPFLPAGLRLRVGFTGDVLSGVEVVPAPAPAPGRPRTDPFHRALSEPVTIGELEAARARSHLRALALALEGAGLGALGRRARLAAAGSPDPHGVATLARRVDRSGFLGWASRGVGVLPAERLAGRGLGPVARAAGIEEDARVEVPAYLDAGFLPVIERGSDGAARWRVRLRETSAALALAARGPDVSVGPLARVEGPRGVITRDQPAGPPLLGLLPTAIDGMEWGDALATILSLDLGDEADPEGVPGGAAAG